MYWVITHESNYGKSKLTSNTLCKENITSLFVQTSEIGDVTVSRAAYTLNNYNFIKLNCLNKNYKHFGFTNNSFE